MLKLVSRAPLGERERETVLGLPTRAVQVPCNRDFVGMGVPVDYACLVVDGLVGRFGQNREGGRQIVAVHIAGDMPGLHSVAAPGAGPPLQALSVATLLEIPNAALRDAARRFPDLAEAFWRECVIDAAVLAEWVLNVGRRSALSRLAHLLCEMACRYKGATPAGNLDYDFAATQNHLADMLGLTPVHVNRTLMALRSEGVVCFTAKRVSILNWDRLAQIGDFDPTYLQLGDGGEVRDQRSASDLANDHRDDRLLTAASAASVGSSRPWHSNASGTGT